jgi:NADH:ubiquinone oxidoreductase subunit K
VIGIQHYLILSAVLFVVGLFGALTKRNAVVILMCVEIMLNAVNVALVATSHYVVQAAGGQVFAIFIMVVAAAEAAVALAIIITIYRNRESIDVSNLNLMKW